MWFFTTDATQRAGELRRPRRRVPRRAVVSAVRLRRLPAARRVIGVVGWHYFWCQTPDAAYTKVSGVALLLRVRQRVPQPGLGSTDVAGKTFDAGGSIGAWLGGAARRLPESHRLDHRAADADDAVGDPVDAVLVRPHVRQRQRRARATSRRAASAASAAGSTSGARSRRGARSIAKHTKKAARRRRRRSRPTPRPTAAPTRPPDDATEAGAARRPSPPVVAAEAAGRRRRCRCPSPSRPRRRAAHAGRVSRCRRPRCSTRRRPSARSTSAS